MPTKTLATWHGYDLVEYLPSGEIRIEHGGSGKCSLWLTSDEVSQIFADPAAMESFATEKGIHSEAETVYVVRDARGEYLSDKHPGGRSSSRDDALVFETREAAKEARDRRTDRVLSRKVV